MNQIATFVLSLFKAPIDLIFPPRCRLCDAFGPHSLCESCAAKMPTPIPEPICPRCGRRREILPCGDCLGDPPYFVIAMAAGEYSGLLKESIHWLKYRDRPMLAEPLGLILAAHAMRHKAALANLTFDAVIPVPLHPARRRQRGYNHAERLARVVARELNLPLRADIIKRVRKTRPQVGLDGDARRKNLAAAFRAHPKKAGGLCILVIDDVSTTSSTLREVAKTLKQAGAKSVYCLTLAAD